MTDMRMRKLAFEDLRTRAEWFNTESVYTQLTIKHPISVNETEEWFRRINDLDTRLDVVFEGPNSDSQSEYFAMAGLVDVDRTHSRAEIYIVVNPQVMGRGIGSKAMAHLCNYGFGRMGLHRLYLYTLVSNVVAQRLYERIGFQLEGTLRSHVFHHGQYVDRYMLGMLRTEWLETSWHQTSAALAEDER